MCSQRYSDTIIWWNNNMYTRTRWHTGTLFDVRLGDRSFQFQCSAWNGVGVCLIEIHRICHFHCSWTQIIYCLGAFRECLDNFSGHRTDYVPIIAYVSQDFNWIWLALVPCRLLLLFARAWVQPFFLSHEQNAWVAEKDQTMAHREN